MKRQFQAFNYKVVNQANETLDVYIDGTIVDAETQEILKNWFGDETSVSYKSFRNQILEAKPKTLNVYINSGGGMVTDAMAIHDLIIEQKKSGTKVNTIGQGLIASAATYILMADENSTMSENSWFMIHNVSGGVYGDVNMIENYARMSRKFNDSSVAFYSKATGLSETVIGNMMDKETWMTASEAKEKGFVKNVTGSESFSNSIQPENWPFANTTVLNAYNAAVKQPPAASDKNNFFSELKNEFMQLFNSLKDAITNGKKDPSFQNVENRDAILDMVQKVLEPVITKIDAAIKNEDPEKPAEEKPADASPEKKEEKKEDKKEEKPAEEKPAENSVEARLANLEAENQKLRNSLAGKATKPAADNGASDKLKNAKVEYED